jgi:long-chain acyl-CoA synthetase
MKSLVSVLRASAKRHHDDVCLRDGESALTFEDVFDQAARFSGALRELGVEPGDRVLVSMDISSQGVIAILGSLLSGAVVAPTSVGAKRRELMHWAQLVEPTVIVAAAAPMAEFTNGEGLAGLTNLKAVLDGSERGDLWDGADPAHEDPALILFTSGTTGLSKGVTRSHEALVRFVETWEARMVREDDVVLNFLPLNHQAGLLLSVLGPMALGAQVVLLPRFSPESFWSAAIAHEVTWTVTMPPVPGLLVGADALPAGATHRLRETLGAGSVIDWRAFEATYNVGMTTAYGSTESTMVTMSPTGREAGTRLDPAHGGSYCGRPVPGWAEVRIHDGEIQLRGGGLFTEYWNNPAATARAFTDDNWFRTGDLGYLTDAGELYLLGRADDRIRRSGENIDPVELETVLEEHPAVADAGITAIADDRRGAEILACVVLKPGAEVTFAELLEHCRAHLSSFKVPRYLEFRAELPKTDGTFRIQRAVLREQADPKTWFDRYAAQA